MWRPDGARAKELIISVTTIQKVIKIEPAVLKFMRTCLHPYIQSGREFIVYNIYIHFITCFSRVGLFRSET